MVLMWLSWLYSALGLQNDRQTDISSWYAIIRCDELYHVQIPCLLAFTMRPNTFWNSVFQKVFSSIASLSLKFQFSDSATHSFDSGLIQSPTLTLIQHRSSVVKKTYIYLCFGMIWSLFDSDHKSLDFSKQLKNYSLKSSSSNNGG